MGAPEERTFWQDLKETMSGSVAALGETGRAVILWGFAVLPWLAVPALIGGLMRGVLRFRRRRKAD